MGQDLLCMASGGAVCLMLVLFWVSFFILKRKNIKAIAKRWISKSVQLAKKSQSPEWVIEIFLIERKNLN